MSRLQVVSWAPTSPLSTPRWLGQYGHVSGLSYSWSCPGGSDQLTCTLWRDARFRADGMNPGRIVQVRCGGIAVWEGIMLEPAPSSNGWTITAVGNGSWGTNYRAVYTGAWTTATPPDAINQAITRGLRWSNATGGPGLGTGTTLLSGWYAQQVDSGAQTITDLLNLVCSNGGYTWYVASPGNILNIFTLGSTGIPSFPLATRLLINPNPVARTLGGNLNRIYERYQVSADATTTAAVFALTHSDDATAQALFGTPIEDYVDLSSAGNQTAVAAQTVGNLILNRYQRASYAGPFTVRRGQLLSTGGQPVDIATEQAASVVRMLMTDYPYGAENVAGVVQFLVGNYAYDDDTETATITPFQFLNAQEQSVAVEPWVTAPAKNRAWALATG